MRTLALTAIQEGMLSGAIVTITAAISFNIIGWLQKRKNK